MFELVLDHHRISVPTAALVSQCGLFQKNPLLLHQPYVVTSRVSLDSLRVFVSSIGGPGTDVSATNAEELSLLSREFDSIKLASVSCHIAEQQLSQGRAICALEEIVNSLLQRQGELVATVQQQQSVIVDIQKNWNELSGRVQQLEQENRRLREMNETMQTQVTRSESELLDGPAKLNTTLLQVQTGLRFPPLLKRVKATDRDVTIDVPDGILAYLARKCGGNIHKRKVIAVTSGSFEKTTCTEEGIEKIVDMGTDAAYYSAFRLRSEQIAHTRNNWVCYDFKERKVVPTHYAIRSHHANAGAEHPIAWAVETSLDANNWREIDHKEKNHDLNADTVTRTFAVTGAAPCRYIRLVNIGKNHSGDDCLFISAWEIFGTLLESE
jgi:hypothetical protein